ncbi:MAG: spore cortex biosynthesis protein YabQ, partial [Clostridia bacterium]
MNTTITNQIYLFSIYFICGIIIGIFFDLFRILRQSFKTSDIVTYIEDIIFGILTGIFLIFIIFIFDNGELRAFTFIALVLGAILYLLTISRYFIRINVNILTFLKKVIVKTFIIISYPFKIIKKYFFKLILRPYKILTINLKNILKNKIIKRKKIKKKYKD